MLWSALAALVLAQAPIPEHLDASSHAILHLVKKVPQVRGIRARYRLVGLVEADLDGDGEKELVGAFKPRREGRKRGGFFVLSEHAGRYRTAWAAIYPASYPETLTVDRDTIRALVVGPSGRGTVVLKYGTDFRYFTDKSSGFRSPTVTVSSTLKAPRGTTIAAQNLVDGDPNTVWAEGAIGTGAGEWIQLEFAKPVNLGLLGVIGGDYRSDQNWEDSNRLQRFEVTTETQEDRSTTVENVDLTRELRLPSTGRRIVAKSKDIRRMKWVEIARKNIVSLKIEATSVYLGDKNDDMYVSEIEFAELLPDPTKFAQAAEEPAPAPAKPTPPIAGKP
jgi:hypothetical protein